VNGDVDAEGDSLDDIIVGAHLLDASRSDEGRALVFHGSSLGLPASPDWTASGGLPAAQFGWRVAGAGDVNGDGYDDAIVGDRFYQNGETDEGRAAVYHGSAAGLSTSSASSDCPR